MPRTQNERGSALLSGLVLLFVITLLGLALFDLSALENRLAATSHTNAEAFEIAQAGLERAVDRLALTVRRERAATPSCLPVPGTPTPPCFNWADGEQPLGAPPVPICVGSCTAAAFTLANGDYIGDTEFSGGSFTVSFMLVAPGLASPWSSAVFGCLTTSAGGTTVCTAFIFVRSTGVAGPTTGGKVPGYAPSRTIQALVGMAPLDSSLPTSWPASSVVTRVSPFWMECRGAAVLPPTPTGACGY